MTLPDRSLAAGDGGHSEQFFCGNAAAEDQARDECLGFLYDREYGGGRNVRGLRARGTVGEALANRH